MFHTGKLLASYIHESFISCAIQILMQKKNVDQTSTLLIGTGIKIVDIVLFLLLVEIVVFSCMCGAATVPCHVKQCYAMKVSTVTQGADIAS